MQSSARVVTCRSHHFREVVRRVDNRFTPAESHGSHRGGSFLAAFAWFSGGATYAAGARRAAVFRRAVSRMLVECPACGQRIEMSGRAARCPNCGRPVLASKSDTFRAPLMSRSSSGQPQQVMPVDEPQVPTPYELPPPRKPFKVPGWAIIAAAL